MGKRKQQAPRYADEVKRQQLQWNMADQMTSSSSFICDGDAELKENTETTLECSAVQLDESSCSTSGTPLHALCVDSFYQNLASCHSTLSILHQDSNIDTSKLIKFGHFTITLTLHPHLMPLPDSLPEFSICWLYVGGADENSMLYFETDGNSEPAVRKKKPKSRQSKFGVFWFVSISIPCHVLTNLKHKAFVLRCSSFDSSLKKFNVNIFGTDGVIMKLSHPSESIRIKTSQLAIQKLMDHFYNVGPPFKYDGIERITGHDFFKLYEGIMHIHSAKLSEDPTWDAEVGRIHHDCLKPTLRYYQKKSVAWMLRQEQRANPRAQYINDLHPLYCEVTLQDGTELYYNKHGGSLIKDRPNAIPSLPGGILADEMGLGKTVEVLCCMLLHPKPNISLPDPLPVIEDSPSGSDENTLSPYQTPVPEAAASGTVGVAENSCDSQQTNDTFHEAVDVDSTVSEKDDIKGRACTINGRVRRAESLLQGNAPPLTNRPHLREDKDAIPFLNKKEPIDTCDLSDSEDSPAPPLTNLPQLREDKDAIPFLNKKEPKDISDLSDSEDSPVPPLTNLPPLREDKDAIPFLNKKEPIDTSDLSDSEDSPAPPLTNLPQLREDKDAIPFLNKKEPKDISDLSDSEDSPVPPLTNLPPLREDKDAIPFLNKKEPIDSSDLPEDGVSPADASETYPCNKPFSSDFVTSQDQKFVTQSGKQNSSKLFVSCTKTENYVIKLSLDGDASSAEHNSFHSSSGSTPRVISMKSFNPALLNNASANNQTNQVSLLRLALTSPEAASADSSKAQPKERRKRKGYVEYVPVSKEDSSYFTTKPTARKQFFECNCGQLDSEEETRRKGLRTVKCNLCGMSQHAECMNYDLHDPYRGEYLCPHCHAVSTTIESGATLIISPYSICHQWIEEIHKHIKERTIRVFIYTGVSKLGYIQPQTLAQQDIVITTYDVLRKELDYVNLPHTNSESGRRFRHPKRFLATPSPLVAVEWWRICLDEAQMVECVSTKTAEMALRLKAVNRWCVTGTPLMRSVEDIYGLLLFLGVDPLMVQQWFRLLLWEPFCHGFQAPMHEALQKILWRTAKKDVIDQIDLPLQTEEIYWLTFSPVEEHFYRRQYEIYLRNAWTYRSRAQRLQDHSIKLHSLDRKTINELLNPLFRLRQACCHPQIVRGEFLPLNKTMMTMEELLEHMTKKVKIECEEGHRQIVASLNGMAGLAIIKEKLDVAVDKYRDVLRSVEEHKGQFRTDDLQQLHAMYNLAEVLDRKPEGVSPTLRDGTLREECASLIEKYMSKTKASVTSSKEALETVQVSLNDLTVKLRALDGDWWADIVDMTTQRGIEAELICKVKDDLMRTSTSEGTIADSFYTGRTLMYVTDTHLQSLTKAHKSLTTGLEKLSKDGSSSLVQQAAVCCLRPVAETLKTCPFCSVDELFNEYESKLFLFVERGVTVSGDDNSMAYLVSTKRQGTWADSEVERALKSIHAFYRLHFETDHDILEAANLQFKYLDTLKKEFKCLRSVWMSYREMISATDECEMATERLRLRRNLEPESATKILNVIEEKDILTHELKLSSDEIVGREELKKKQGQLIYLINLAKKNQNGEGCNPDSCPVCQCGLGVDWSVLLCGHCFCLRCIRALMDRNFIGGNLVDRRLKCPLCRHLTPVRDISYVTTRKAGKVNVTGSHSTKVQAILECLIKIREEDPKAKSLVFSVWVSVLDILAAGLTENKILYKSLHDLNYFQKNLSAFKTEDSIQVLLLPLHSGANGLNLVEANHILLVEPELNLEEEAQAISRIYRIGQTRQTKIHRFLVRGTIEEKIFHMVKSLRESSSDASGGDDIELTVGHITSLLQQPSPEDEDDEGTEAGNGQTDASAGLSIQGSMDGQGVPGLEEADSSGVVVESSTVQH